MSRNGSGTYTLPSGNPVVSGTLIEATWANSTLSDIASALTDSLSRSGQGGMTAAFRAFDGTSSVPGIAWGSETTTGWYRAGAGDMRLVVTGSEVIRYQAAGVAITGTLGVGTTSLGSGTRLEVRAANTITDGRGLIAVNTTNAAAANVGGSISLGGETGQATTPYVFGSVAGRYEGSGYSGYLQLSTTSSGGVVTERARIDSAGNLGLGVTPSAWASAWKVLQNQGGFFGSNATNSLRTASNSYSDGTNWRYVNNGSAAAYQIADNTHQWHVAPSGTAGNAISFTQAMTLDASGRLGIGVTSPQAPLHARVGSNQNIYLDSSGGVARITAVNDAVNDNIDLIVQGERLIFNTDGSERARIDSSGNLLVGTTSVGGRLSVLGNAGGTCASFNANSNTVTPVGIIVGGNDTTQAALYVYSNGNGAFNAYIYSNGNLQNRNNSYGGISDARLKENVADATPKLEKLNQVRVVNYNLIGDSQKQLGVIAQELEQIFPGMVEEAPDRDAEGNDLGTTTKSVKYSVFVPMLIKAMQEQQAIIEQLKADVAALKG